MSEPQPDLAEICLSQRSQLSPAGWPKTLRKRAELSAPALLYYYDWEFRILLWLHGRAFVGGRVGGMSGAEGSSDDGGECKS